MAGGEIVAGFFLWVLEVSDYGQVNHGRLLTNHEGLAREMPFQDPEEIIKPVFKKLEHIWIGRRSSPAELFRFHRNDWYRRYLAVGARVGEGRESRPKVPFTVGLSIGVGGGQRT